MQATQLNRRRVLVYKMASNTKTGRGSVRVVHVPGIDPPTARARSGPLTNGAGLCLSSAAWALPLPNETKPLVPAGTGQNTQQPTHN